MHCTWVMCFQTRLLSWAKIKDDGWRYRRRKANCPCPCPSTEVSEAALNKCLLQWEVASISWILPSSPHLLHQPLYSHTSLIFFLGKKVVLSKGRLCYTTWFQWSSDRDGWRQRRSRRRRRRRGGGGKLFHIWGKTLEKGLLFWYWCRLCWCILCICRDYRLCLWWLWLCSHCMIGQQSSPPSSSSWGGAIFRRD